MYNIGIESQEGLHSKKVPKVYMMLFNYTNMNVFNFETKILK